jgi:hypothetical protein
MIVVVHLLGRRDQLLSIAHGRCRPVLRNVERETGGCTNEKKYLNILDVFMQKETFKKLKKIRFSRCFMRYI